MYTNTSFIIRKTTAFRDKKPNALLYASTSGQQFTLGVKQHLHFLTLETNGIWWIVVMWLVKGGSHSAIVGIKVGPKGDKLTQSRQPSETCENAIVPNHTTPLLPGRQSRCHDIHVPIVEYKIASMRFPITQFFVWNTKANWIHFSK